jgi:hypothetical protein
MNLTGAELITRFLAGCSPGVAPRVARFGEGRALQALARALGPPVRPPLGADAAGVLVFDYRSHLAPAAELLRAARAQRRPLLALAVQAPRAEIGGAGCRPEDARRAFDAMAPHWFHVNAAAELVMLLPEVYRRAQRGPALLEIPQDVLAERIEGAWIPSPPPRLPASVRKPLLGADRLPAGVSLIESYY